MKSIVIPFNDNTLFERISQLLHRLKVPFVIQEVPLSDINDPTIVWDWHDVQTEDFAKISEPAFIQDWLQPEDAIWDNL